jgi:hypothetical protein
MENKSTSKGKSTGLYSGWSWLLWWQISPSELERQVSDYDSLKIIQSARGISFLGSIFFFTVVMLSLIMTFSPEKALWEYWGFLDSLILLALGFCIYRGHRWAIVVAIIYWTIGKFAVVFQYPEKAILILAWWCLYMHALYAALRVDILCKKYNPVKYVGNGLLYIIGFILVCAAGVLGKDFANYVSGTLFNKKVSVNEMLIAISANLNKKTPMIIDQNTRLDSSAVSGNKLIYKYTMVNFNSEIQDPASADNIKKVRSNILNGVCGDSMKPLRVAGADFVYLYYDNQGAEIIRFDIDSSECAP